MITQPIVKNTVKSLYHLKKDIVGPPSEAPENALSVSDGAGGYEYFKVDDGAGGYEHFKVQSS